MIIPISIAKSQLIFFKAIGVPHPHAGIPGKQGGSKPGFGASHPGFGSFGSPPAPGGPRSKRRDFRKRDPKAGESVISSWKFSPSLRPGDAPISQLDYMKTTKEPRSERRPIFHKHGPGDKPYVARKGLLFPVYTVLEFFQKAMKQVKQHVRAGHTVSSYAQRKRDGEALPVFGRPWEQIKQQQQGTWKPETIDVNKPGDYGADPLGDGKWRMVPSGDVVDREERERRLKKAQKLPVPERGKMNVELYLVVSPRMSPSENYVASERVKDILKHETPEKKAEERETAMATARNRTGNPQKDFNQQNKKFPPQYIIQYGLGETNGPKHRNEGGGSAVPR